MFHFFLYNAILSAYYRLCDERTTKSRHQGKRLHNQGFCRGSRGCVWHLASSTSRHSALDRTAPAAYLACATGQPGCGERRARAGAGCALPPSRGMARHRRSSGGKGYQLRKVHGTALPATRPQYRARSYSRPAGRRGIDFSRTCQFSRSRSAPGRGRFLLAPGAGHQATAGNQGKKSAVAGLPSYYRNMLK